MSTGHIPLVIVYRHRDTGEELTYEAYNEMLDTLVDKLIDEGRNFGYIRDALQNKIAEYQERHREVQLIEWSVVTLGSNANAEVKVIKNSMEEAKEDFSPEQLNETVEQDDPEAPTEEENQEEKSDQNGEKNLKNEGETPEATDDTPPKDSENEDDGEKESDPSENEGDEEQEGKGSEKEQTPPQDNPEPQTNSSQELVNLKANELVLKKQIEILQEENNSLKKEKSDLEEELSYFTNKKVCHKADLKENRTDAKRLEQLKANVARILRQ